MTMIKRIMSVLSACSLSVGMFCGTGAIPAAQNTVFAADTEKSAGSLTVATATAKAGETVSVPVMLDENPGVAAMRLSVRYDASKLKLTGAENGGSLEGAEFLAGSDLTASPFYLVWDSVGAEDLIVAEDLCFLQFEVLEGASGSASVSVNVEQAINKELEDVTFSCTDGEVLIAAGSLHAETPEKPVPYATRFSVPVYLDENPGVTAFRLGVEYDTSVFQLENTPANELFSGAEFDPGEDPKHQPLYFVWDDTKVHTETGLLLTLEFSVIKKTDAEIAVTFTADAADDTPAMIGISGDTKKIKLVSSAETAQTTTETTQITTSKTTTAKTTTSKTTTSKTTTSKTTTAVTTAADPQKPVDVNGDGKKSVADVVCFVVFITEGRSDKEPAAVDSGLTQCDFDGDGILTILDVMILLRKIAAL